jgi:hypothetical protein
MRHGLLACLVAFNAFADEVPSSNPIRRFALLVGSNEGGNGTRPLRYAAENARRLHEVMLRIGGVDPNDAVLMVNESSHHVLTALAELGRRAREVRSRGERTSLFFYYSGHATEGALHLGTTRLPVEAVKRSLTQEPADARIAVFDFCCSGSLPSTKGSRQGPVFAVETDSTRATLGLVILTSSTDSQESDATGSTDFSYHLISGLLGSADQSGDGSVSLAEVAASISERTVASTDQSSAAPHQPTFDFDLAGNGELVLTDITQRHEGLRIPADAPPGTYVLINSHGIMVAETTKTERERVIALSPGAYTVLRRLADRLRVGAVRIADGQFFTLNERALKNTKLSADPVTGTGLNSAFGRHWSISAVGQYQAVLDAPTSAGAPFPSTPMVGGEATVHNFFGRGFAWSLDGQYGWSSGVAVSSRLGLPAAYRYSLISVGTSLLYEWNQDDTWVPFLGARLGVNMMNREFDEAIFPRQGFTTISPGIAAGLKLRIGRNVCVVARGRMHYLLYNVDESRSLGLADVGLMLNYEFRDSK